MDYHWYESRSPSPQSPTSPVEQQVFVEEAAVGATATGYLRHSQYSAGHSHHPHYPAASFGRHQRNSGMPITSSSAQVPNIYNLNAFPLPNGEDGTSGLSFQYPIPMTSHHHHHHHHHHHTKHHSEHASSLPHHEAMATARQYHNYYYSQRAGSGRSYEKERLRRVTSPEMQLQRPLTQQLLRPPPRGARAHSSSSPRTTHYSQVVFNERGRQVQRRSSDRRRERPVSDGSGMMKERRMNFECMTAQRSDGSLEYSSAFDRGTVYSRDGGVDSETLLQPHHLQRGREWGSPRQLSPSRSEMRSPVFTEMNAAHDGYDSLERYRMTSALRHGERHGNQVTVEEQRYTMGL